MFVADSALLSWKKVSSSIQTLGKYFQFPVECHKPHLSKSSRLEMAGDRVKPSEFETRKKSYLELSFTKVRRFAITFTRLSFRRS